MRTDCRVDLFVVPHDRLQVALWPVILGTAAEAHSLRGDDASDCEWIARQLSRRFPGMST